MAKRNHAFFDFLTFFDKLYFPDLVHTRPATIVSLKAKVTNYLQGGSFDDFVSLPSRRISAIIIWVIHFIVRFTECFCWYKEKFHSDFADSVKKYWHANTQADYPKQQNIRFGEWILVIDFQGNEFYPPQDACQKKSKKASLRFAIYTERTSRMVSQPFLLEFRICTWTVR